MQTLKEASALLQKAGIDNATQEARWLWQHVMARAWYEPLTEISPEKQLLFQQLLERRCRREPLAQIIGRQPFWSLDFSVNIHTLIPRSDSEVVIETALEALSEKHTPYRLLDLGTGTGCLALTLLYERPEATALAVDISSEALEVARENAEKLQLQNRITFQQTDWAEGITEVFDLIISNPPYIPEGEKTQLMPEVRDYEPHQALFAGEDGLAAYRHIAKQAMPRLKPGGFMVLELGIHQAESVKEIFVAQGLKWLKTRCDLGGIERAIIFQKG
jgi:release factor glutamine methyltransferase